MLVAVPAVFLHQTLINHVPLVLQAPILAAGLAIYVFGWMPAFVPVFQHPLVVPAAAGHCERMQLVLMGVSSATMAVHG